MRVGRCQPLHGERIEHIDNIATAAKSTTSYPGFRRLELHMHTAVLHATLLLWMQALDQPKYGDTPGDIQ